MAGYEAPGPPETAAHETESTPKNYPDRPHTHHDSRGLRNGKRKNRDSGAMTLKFDQRAGAKPSERLRRQ